MTETRVQRKELSRPGVPRESDPYFNGFNTGTVQRGLNGKKTKDPVVYQYRWVFQVDLHFDDPTFEVTYTG